MNLQQIHLPNPISTPYTWYLQQYVQTSIDGLSILESCENTPDIVCYPGHMLTVHTTLSLLSLANPGMDIRNPPDYDALYESLSRATTSPDIFACFLPSIGRYILYLWLIRSFVMSGDKKWRIAKICFGSKQGNCYPNVDCPAIFYEWFWVSEFLLLSAILCEPNLDLIPAFWSGGTRDDVVGHPEWHNRRSFLLQALPTLPYILKQQPITEQGFAVIAEAQGTDLYTKLTIVMAALELQILRTLDLIRSLWLKMRSQGTLESPQVDEVLTTRINWQMGQWPDAFIKDHDLNTTAMRLTFIRDWCDSRQRAAMQHLSKGITSIFKTASGYGRGRPPLLQHIDESATNILTALIPDLIKVLEIVWPFKEITQHKKDVKALSLSLLQPTHFNFPWEQVKQNDRLDFCAKIVHEYLLDITGRDYKLKAIYQALSGKLPK